MVELYVEGLKKSIEELELDKELEKYVKHHSQPSLGQARQDAGSFWHYPVFLLLPLSVGDRGS